MIPTSVTRNLRCSECFYLYALLDQIQGAAGHPARGLSRIEREHNRDRRSIKLHLNHLARIGLVALQPLPLPGGGWGHVDFRVVHNPSRMRWAPDLSSPIPGVWITPKPPKRAIGVKSTNGAHGMSPVGAEASLSESRHGMSPVAISLLQGVRSSSESPPAPRPKSPRRSKEQAGPARDVGAHRSGQPGPTTGSTNRAQPLRAIEAHPDLGGWEPDDPGRPFSENDPLEHDPLEHADEDLGKGQDDEEAAACDRVFRAFPGSDYVEHEDTDSGMHHGFGKHPPAPLDPAPLSYLEDEGAPFR
jgi:hypothetical protein